MKKTILTLILLVSVNSKAGFFEELDKLKKAAEVVKDITGKSVHSCTAKTSFDGSYTAEASTENAARADAENKCISAGVSWMFCDDIKCTKR